MPTNDDVQLQREFEAFIETARRISGGVGDEVEEVLRAGQERPLSSAETRELLGRVITVLRRNGQRRGDAALVRALEGDINALVERLLEREGGEPAGAADRNGQAPRLRLIARNGVEPGPVRPRPCFHGREIPMAGGYVKTTDIKLWRDNERLDIHIDQFRQENGRDPTPEEILDIMLSRMMLPGLNAEDQFQIVALARSIAVNGVRKPPILDLGGTPRDGNRRIAACYYILNNDEFTTEEKRRAEYIYVWQFTEDATEPEMEGVVVSLNFESDCKLDWPEYIKARKVHDEWEAMVALEPRLPNPQRQAQMKRELSKRFALGPETSVVNRYLKMVKWATAFEEYHVNEKRRDEYEVKHRTNRYFQYFDELAKGGTTEGVAHALQQDDGFRKMVFDLLYDGKFRNWRQIRELKLIYDNQEARDALGRARNEPDLELAEDHLENAMAIARSRRAEQREVGANTRIETFVQWLEELPVRAFRDSIRPQNLRRLLTALRLVEGHAAAILDGQEGGA